MGLFIAIHVKLKQKDWTVCNYSHKIKTNSKKKTSEIQ